MANALLAAVRAVISTPFFELVGVALVVAGVWVLAGVGWALVVAGALALVKSFDLALRGR